METRRTRAAPLRPPHRLGGGRSRIREGRRGDDRRDRADGSGHRWLHQRSRGAAADRVVFGRLRRVALCRGGLPATTERSDRRQPMSFLVGMVLGGIVGAAAALLATPQSGAENRELLYERFPELRERAAEMLTVAREEAKSR